jgi:hypothetical protein
VRGIGPLQMRKITPTWVFVDPGTNQYFSFILSKGKVVPLLN